MINISLLLFSLLLIVLYFRKHKAFPPVFIVYVLAAPVALAIDTVLANKVSGSTTAPREVGVLLGMVFRSALWCWYVVVSVRVRKTFVH